MKLSFEELKLGGISHFEIDANLNGFEITDALIKQVNDVFGTLDVSLIENDTFQFDFDVKYNVDYLDARNLNPLNLNFEMIDGIMLTTNKDKAEELDIDFIEEDEIDILELVLELILVNIPYNYSEAPSMVVDEEDGMYHPFANINFEEE